MSGTIRVMHTVLSLETGGLERIVAESALMLDKSLFHVEVCCFDRLGEFAGLLEEKGIRVTLLEKNQCHYDYLYPLRLQKFLREKRIHVLHMHSGTFFLGAQAGVLARVPALVYTDHGRLMETNLQLLTDRLAGVVADRIVAVSRELASYLGSVVRLPPGKTTTIINGINTDHFRPREKSARLLAELGIPDGSTVIGTVGRMAEVKDQVSMVEAFAHVREQFPQTFLVLVGDGPLAGMLKERAVARGVGDRVIFAGNRSDVGEILNLLDIFLLTSLSEGTSVALLEAMATGVPPVVTAVGGNVSIVEDGVNGLLVTPREVTQLSRAVADLVEDREKRLAYGRNARRTVCERFALKAMVESYADLYVQILKRKGRAPAGPSYLRRVEDP